MNSTNCSGLVANVSFALPHTFRLPASFKVFSLREEATQNVCMLVWSTACLPTALEHPSHWKNESTHGETHASKF